MEKLLGLIIVSSLAVAVTATDFINCTYGGSPPIAVRLDGCEVSPCTALVGSRVSGEMDFVAPSNLTSMRPVITAYALGISLDIPINQTDGCQTLKSGACPLLEGAPATYGFAMDISHDYDGFHGIRADIEFAFLDAQNQTAVCARVHSVVKEEGVV